jgi:hypothetical protein
MCRPTCANLFRRPVEPKLQQRPSEGSRLVVLEGAPHGLNWTHADQLNRALLEFLGKGKHSSHRYINAPPCLST